MARARKIDAPREFVRDFGGRAGEIWLIWSLLYDANGRAWFDTGPSDILVASNPFGWHRQRFENVVNELRVVGWLEWRFGGSDVRRRQYRLRDQRQEALRLPDPKRIENPRLGPRKGIKPTAAARLGAGQCRPLPPAVKPDMRYRPVRQRTAPAQFELAF